MRYILIYPYKIRTLTTTHENLNVIKVFIVHFKNYLVPILL